MFIEKPKRPVIMIMAGLLTKDKSELIIGKDNDLPWSLPKDLKFFKEVTMGCDIVVGKNTFLSLPAEMEGRNIHVVSSTLVSNKPSVKVHEYLDDCIDRLQMQDTEKPIFIIGGAMLYKEARSLCDYCILTELTLPDYEHNFGFLDTDKTFVKLPVGIKLEHQHYNSPKLLLNSGFKFIANGRETNEPVILSLSVTGNNSLPNKYLSKAIELFKEIFIFKRITENIETEVTIDDDLHVMYNFLKSRNEISGDLQVFPNSVIDSSDPTSRLLCIDSYAIVYYQNLKREGQNCFHLSSTENPLLYLNLLKQGEKFGVAIPVFVESIGQPKLSGYELYLFTAGVPGVIMGTTSPKFNPSLDNLILALRPK